MIKLHFDAAKKLKFSNYITYEEDYEKNIIYTYK